MAKYNIYKDGEFVNKIAASENYATYYCEANGYTFELIEEPETPPAPKPKPEPTDTDVLNALLGVNE